MKRQDFARLCLVISLVGLGVMYLSTYYLGPETVEPSDVSREDIGSTVSVKGNVLDFYMTDSASFFTLKGETSGIKVSDFQKRSLSTGEVRVTGSVDLYRGDLQLVASKVERLE
jgi:RecJ-like exonuclease